MIVWVDENMKDILRKYGYALCGERAVCPRLQLLVRLSTTEQAPCQHCN